MAVESQECDRPRRLGPREYLQYAHTVVEVASAHSHTPEVHMAVVGHKPVVEHKSAATSKLEVEEAGEAGHRSVAETLQDCREDDGYLSCVGGRCCRIRAPGPQSHADCHRSLCASPSRVVCHHHCSNAGLHGGLFKYYMCVSCDVISWA